MVNKNRLKLSLYFVYFLPFHNMPIYRLGDLSPEIHPTAFIAPCANLIGNVKVEAGASVWFGVTIRADNDLITIGENTNVQDGAMLHADPGYPLKLGKNVTIGHKAILHGCTVNDGALIGIRATVLNGSVIGKNTLVGAGALVTENKDMPNNALIIGAPARVAKTMTDEEAKRTLRPAKHYIKQNKRYQKDLEKIG